MIPTPTPGRGNAARVRVGEGKGYVRFRLHDEHESAAGAAAAHRKELSQPAVWALLANIKKISWVKTLLDWQPGRSKKARPFDRLMGRHAPPRRGESHPRP